jgi:hypothetical protein
MRLLRVEDLLLLVLTIVKCITHLILWLGGITVPIIVLVSQTDLTLVDCFTRLIDSVGVIRGVVCWVWQVQCLLFSYFVRRLLHINVITYFCHLIFIVRLIYSTDCIVLVCWHNSLSYPRYWRLVCCSQCVINIDVAAIVELDWLAWTLIVSLKWWLGVLSTAATYLSHHIVVLGVQPSTDATLVNLVSRIDGLVGIALINHILLELSGLIVLFKRYLLHVHLLLWD